jgi:hypothetical protein
MSGSLEPRAGEDRRAESRAREWISRLVAERHRLREWGSPLDELEENRLAIVAAQQELGRILIHLHGPAAPAPQSA